MSTLNIFTGLETDLLPKFIQSLEMMSEDSHMIFLNQLRAVSNVHPMNLEIQLCKTNKQTNTNWVYLV